MADYEADELRSFEDFSEAMTNFSYLRPIDEKRRKQLLRELYQAAVGKDVMEKWAKASRDKLPEYRAVRRRKLKTAGLLRKALQALTEARAAFGDELAACEAESNTTGNTFTFGVMEEKLNFSVEVLEAHAAMNAADVNPKWRTDAEKRLATKYMAAIDDSRSAKVHNWPSGEKARALDAWFIRTAADCIDRCKPKTRTIKGYDILIAKLCDAAFGGHRSQASVQKVLARRGKRSEPHYSPPVRIKVVFHDERTQPNMPGPSGVSKILVSPF